MSHLIHITDNRCAKDTLHFLWQQEVVDFKRFGEMLNPVQEYMSKTNMCCGYGMEE